MSVSVRAVAAAEVADAYVWGLPLVTMHRTCAAHGGVGRGMFGRGRLATAADRTVVAPNNDTLYAWGWFDLRAGDLAVDVGAMDTPDRYWSVMLLDAYTNVTYVCRRLHGTAGACVRVTYDPSAAPPADVRAAALGVGVGAAADAGDERGRPVYDELMAGPPAEISVRPLDGTADDLRPAGPGWGAPVGCGSAAGRPADDLRARPLDGTADAVGGPAGARGDVRAAAEGPFDAVALGTGRASSPQAGPTGSPRSRAGAGGGAVTVAAGGAAEGVVTMGTPTVWVLARVLVDGPGDLPAARAAQSRIQVAQPPAGGSGDTGDRARRGRGGFLDELWVALAADPPAPWHPAPPPGLAALLRDPPDPEIVAAGIARGKILVARSGGVDRWGNGWGTRSRGARFGDDVAYRAAFARVSLAGHLPEENRSYTRAFDGAAPAVLRFPAGGEPPVDGFWSLCAYGPDLFLVENAIDRYSIGDRTPGLRRDPDGGLTIALGAACPPGAAAGNWLPTPAGPCFLSLRAYEGRAPVVAAEWFPPDLESLP